MILGFQCMENHEVCHIYHFIMNKSGHTLFSMVVLPFIHTIKKRNNYIINALLNKINYSNIHK
jgi:hypothetical protein